MNETDNILSIAPEFFEKLEVLKAYHTSNTLLLSNDNIMRPILNYMAENGLYDKTIVNEVIEINKILSKNSILYNVSFMYYNDEGKIDDVSKYDMARLFIKVGIRVKDIFYNDRVSYLLHNLIENYDMGEHDKISFENYLPYETSLWEDFNELEKLNYDLKDNVL